MYQKGNAEAVYIYDLGSYSEPHIYIMETPRNLLRTYQVVTENSRNLLGTSYLYIGNHLGTISEPFFFVG